jgi:hypothetical protein
VVERLDTPQVYINYLTTLGRKHIMYEAEPELLDQIGYLFLTSIKTILEKEVSHFPSCQGVSGRFDASHFV